MGIHRLSSLVFCLSALCALSASAQDVGSILAAAERAYHAATSFRAEFTQTIENPMLGAPERSRGVMVLNPPDRFAMRFSQPPGDRIVADGKWLWLYTPSTTPGQVIRQPIPRAGAATPNFFAQFVERPLERYTATRVGTDTVAGAIVDVVRLLPRFDDQPFREAVIAIARKDGLMRRVALVEETGQRRTIVLPAPEAGARVPDPEYRFRVPKGVKVVTP
ncbi:MAG: outer membrane lipoprotein carrier protein LolA [Gemmatimonadetes bacterium]|nr:outer membrane lipoprotein carrier protein LolA [Gemmatimonadota bacterium]